MKRKIAFGAIIYLSCMAAAGLASATPPANPPAHFWHCARCHSTQEGETKIGPSLAGVFGRTSGSVPGYNYSAALKNSHIIWDAQTLDKLLQGPNGLVPGIKMSATVRDPNTRQRVIAYLKTLSPQSAASQ